jgi:hypothetical protein
VPRSTTGDPMAEAAEFPRGWVALWPDGRRVEVTLEPVETRGATHWVARSEGECGRGWSSPKDALSLCVHGLVVNYGPYAELLPAGEPTRAELRAIEDAAVAVIEAENEYDAAEALTVNEPGATSCVEWAARNRAWEALRAALGKGEPRG